MVFEPHVSSEELEAYFVGLSLDDDLQRVEEHVLICERCQDELALSGRYTRPTKEPVVALDTGKRLQSIHITEDGPIFGAMHMGANGKWLARHWGRQLNGGCSFDSVKDAYTYLVESFQQMFPEHLCVGRCRGSKCQE